MRHSKMGQVSTVTFTSFYSEQYTWQMRVRGSYRCWGNDQFTSTESKDCNRGSDFGSSREQALGIDEQSPVGAEHAREMCCAESTSRHSLEGGWAGGRSDGPPVDSGCSNPRRRTLAGRQRGMGGPPAQHSDPGHSLAKRTCVHLVTLQSTVWHSPIQAGQ